MYTTVSETETEVKVVTDTATEVVDETTITTATEVEEKIVTCKPAYPPPHYPAHPPPHYPAHPPPHYPHHAPPHKLAPSYDSDLPLPTAFVKSKTEFKPYHG